MNKVNIKKLFKEKTNIRDYTRKEFGYEIEIYWEFDEEYIIKNFYLNWKAYGDKDTHQTDLFITALMETNLKAKMLNEKYKGYKLVF